ncbi:superoxide dismutase family protein [Scleromatobacter humisilvae]|uniref:Superoxide dismutase [Cu-Zn] n=1 Tax=Scleromatobacter humisilvae TaxID=2897159 RepID=A0A9X1YM11_9BURK|nr:superoxide dismutase family protein [Scleromatobacter humisilvae]MCK9687370.1 superoxide dismutase family protein [Scleromatobacter humisilvae]
MRLALTLSLATAVGLAGCAHKPTVEPISVPAPAPAPAPSASPEVKVTEPFFSRTKSAVATLTPSATSGVTGIVTFSGGSTSVDVHVIAAGLQPGSIHAFHVHENGTCASADFMTAGGHFNPTHKPHGPQDKPHHAGDMPSLLADPAGKIDTRFTLEGVTVGGTDGFVGHAVILHAVADDYDAQPTGNSGARIACGVIAAQ